MGFPINVYITSVTGNTMSFVENFLDKNTKSELRIVRKLRGEKIEGTTIAIACSTWDDGKIPRVMKKWLIENAHDLNGKNVLIFGSGYTLFQHYCKAVDSVAQICEESGAKTFLKLKFEQVWDESKFSLEEIDSIKEEINKWEETNNG